MSQLIRIMQRLKYFCFYNILTDFGKVIIAVVDSQCGFKTSHKPYESNSESKFIKMSKKRLFQTVFFCVFSYNVVGSNCKNQSFILIDPNLFSVTEKVKILEAL